MTTLKLGSSGQYVVQLKRRLADAGLVTPEGPIFDAATEQAVRDFQASHEDTGGRPLHDDGVVGHETWLALGGVPEPMREWANGRGYLIAGIALNESLRGVREQGGNNRGADIEAYQRATALSGTGWAWCAAFVTWCYERSGLFLRDAGGFAAVAALRSWATRAGHWRPREPGYRPPTGAIVIYTFSHTGIVLFGGEQEDHTVEGNTSSGARGSQRDGDCVFCRARSHRSIRGYVVLPDIVLS
jgi:peptidoglycan hydrolase-like protein with peptidoglycan-binding domain